MGLSRWSQAPGLFCVDLLLKPGFQGDGSWQLSGFQMQRAFGFLCVDSFPVHELLLKAVQGIEVPFFLKVFPL